MLVTRQLPALYNGVSQQPAPVRLPSQCEEAVNCMFSVVDGASRRSPMEYVAKLTSDRLGTALLHTINRDVVERYEVIVTAAGIRVFDMQGVEKAVTAPLGWGYLSLPDGAEARYSYVCMTVADYTFVLNKTKTVEMLAVGADHDPPSDGYWWLNRPLESTPSPMRQPITEVVDEPVFGGGGNDTPSNPTPAPTPVGNPTAAALTGVVQTLQDLPTTPTVGTVFKVVGTNESNYQSYYVVRSVNETWDETVRPGLKNLVNAETMPHALVRQGDGSFIFGPFAWSPRRVGDDFSNPHPTFVGRKIRDMFFYRNSFGVCVDENVCLSRAGDFGNFYRFTVVDYLPDEVVDIAASETKVTKMEFAVPFQGSLMLWSDQTQFKLTHNEVLSGATVSLDVSTQYPMVPGVRPAASGADVYFASQGSGYGVLREYFVNPEGTTHDAAEVTSHVPYYIPRNVTQIAAAPEYDTVYLLSSAKTNRIYVYKYYWQTETEKAQSAWNYWEFADDVNILAVAPLGGYLMCLVDRPDGTFLERIAMFYGSLPAGLPFQVYLDRRFTVTGVYDPATDLTTFALPYGFPTPQQGNFLLVTGAGFEATEGMGAVVPVHEWLLLEKFTVKGDYSLGECVGGIRYETRYAFSRQYPQNSRGEAIHTGRLQLKTFSVYYTETAYFRAEVKPYGATSSQTYAKEFSPYRVNVDGLATIGKTTLHSGKASFSVQANAGEALVTLVNDSHLASTWHSAEWEGFYHNRARA